MDLEVRLDPIEARVFGVLIEKALTTPDQYPLTINAATNAANQKSNRHPVLSLSESEVASALARLEKKYLARKVFPGNSRVEKYVHNGKDALGLDMPQLAVIAELLMRGPQTPGDIRARAGRMIAIESLDQLATILAPLMERGFVQRLPPPPGSRAELYVQLVSPDLHPLEQTAPLGSEQLAAVPRPAATNEIAARVAALEDEVERLREHVRALSDKVGRTTTP
jgi:hypothetical protein